MICAYLHNCAPGWAPALERALACYHPQLVSFTSLEQLSDLSIQTLLDVVVVPVNGSTDTALSLALGAKSIPALTAVPVVLWLAQDDADAASMILESSIDDLIIGGFEDPIAAARLRLALRRSWRDLDVNPSSRLPGPTTIERVISERLARRDHFAVCYADLDDFKAYNDYYGYFYGDKVIKLVARVIRETVYDHQPDGFVGHIGGDDFVFVIPPEKISEVCQAVIQRFDAEVPLCYEARDRRNGYIISKSRRGTPETYGLLTLSIAVAVNYGDTFDHVGQISHMVADLKRYTKTLPGSNFMVERRKKY
ncbi:MAG TPA: diguanylate cyclase [bacterium]|jgi:diguanylate cyclase (GGDEF)-like protein|nr:diguanylate cyclase [bacterium]